MSTDRDEPERFAAHVGPAGGVVLVGEFTWPVGVILAEAPVPVPVVIAWPTGRADDRGAEL